MFLVKITSFFSNINKVYFHKYESFFILKLNENSIRVISSHTKHLCLSDHRLFSLRGKSLTYILYSLRTCRTVLNEWIYFKG